MSTIAVFTSNADFVNTNGKNVWLGKWLKQAGYDVLMLCWDEHNAANFRLHKLPYLMMQVESKTCDTNAAAMDLDALLTAPIVSTTRLPAPSLGKLLAFDDYIGCAKVWSLEGAEAAKFDCLVSTMLPAEFTVSEDAVLALQLWRYTSHNRIPHIGVECSSLDNDLILNQWPVDMLLTKADPRISSTDDAGTQPCYARIAPEVYQMDRSCRYMLSLGSEPFMDPFYNEARFPILSQLATIGQRFLYLPFHLSYKEHCLELLEGIEPYREELIAAGFGLLISVDSRQFRRMLTERDMVEVGMKRWLNRWQHEGIPRQTVVEGPSMIWLMDMAQAVLAPCETVGTEWCRRWGVPVIKPGEEHRIAELSLGTSVVEAVRWMMEKAKTED